MADHEFTLTPEEQAQLPDLDPDALCAICGDNAEAHLNQEGD
jgi:hypothetical protein